MGQAADWDRRTWQACATTLGLGFRVKRHGIGPNRSRAQSLNGVHPTTLGRKHLPSETHLSIDIPLIQHQTMPGWDTQHSEIRIPPVSCDEHTNRQQAGPCRSHQSAMHLTGQRGKGLRSRRGADPETSPSTSHHPHLHLHLHRPLSSPTNTHPCPPLPTLTYPYPPLRTLTPPLHPSRPPPIAPSTTLKCDTCLLEANVATSPVLRLRVKAALQFWR